MYPLHHRFISGQLHYIHRWVCQWRNKKQGVQLQLSQEDPLSSLMQSPPSKQKDKPLPAPMKKQLPWNLHCPGHSPMPTITQSPYSFAQTVIPHVKPSYHPTLEHPSSTIPSTPFHFLSSSSGSLAIPPFQVTISPTQQPKNPPAATIATDTIISISLSSSINKTILDAPPIHEQVASVCKHRRVSRDRKQNN